MLDQPLPPDAPPAADMIEAKAPAPLPMEQRANGTLVIDLLAPAPPPQDCAEREPDPFHPEIVVCRAQGLSPRLGREAIPEVDDFGNAVPRARWKLSDKATLETNAINQGVGGWNANGGEVRVRIGF